MADETKSWWMTALQTVGFPIVAAIGLGWFAYQTIQWEREQMMPAIAGSTEALRNNTETMKLVKSALDTLSRHLPKGDQEK